MLRHLLISNGDIKDYIISLLLSLPIVFLALSLHETAHGFIASKLGDPTAKSLGRLTMNPLKHIDPIGFICMVLFGFGWAKPVPINTRYFKKPRRDMALCSLAGPVSNILLAIVFAILLKAASMILTSISYPSELTRDLAQYFLIFLYYGISLNVTLAVFNLIPIPPLDGSRILSAFLPPKLAYAYIKHERIISIILMILLFVGVLSPVISIFTNLVITGIILCTLENIVRKVRI